jgi:hypothetical protein
MHTTCLPTIDKREALNIIHSLGTSGQPPRLGALHVNVGTDQLLRRLSEDYLQGLCASTDGLDGQGICKWVEGDYGNGKTQFLRCFQEIAWGMNFVTAFVELSQDECPLDRPERVYGAVARSVQARPLNAGDVDRSKGFDLALAQLLDRRFPKVLTGVPNDSLKAEAVSWVETVLRNLAVESSALRSAAVTHLLARLHGDEDKINLSGLYLRGEPVPPVELRKIGIYEKIDKPNGFRVLRTMCQLLQRSGLAGGTVLLFDEARRTLSLMSAKGQKVACENLLSVINRCNQGELPGTVFLYAVMPEFFTNFAVQYPALLQRCGHSTRIPLNTIQGIKESDLLMMIGHRIVQIYGLAYDIEHKGGVALENSLKLIANAAIQQTMGTGTRRLFVKTCVQMLHNFRSNGISELDAASVEQMLAGVNGELTAAEAQSTTSQGE